MKFISKISILFIVIVLLSNCGGAGRAIKSENKTKLDLPDWFVNPPESKEFIYGTGTAESKMLKVAISKAKLEAKGNIAATISSKIERLKKDFIESTGLSKQEEIISQFTQVQKEITSQELIGVVLEEQSLNQNNNIYIVYVLMKYPVGKMGKDFVQRLSANEKLWTEFKASKAYDELKQEIEEYEEKRGY